VAGSFVAASPFTVEFMEIALSPGVAPTTGSALGYRESRRVGVLGRWPRLVMEVIGPEEMFL
jgi:hypothetical protein